MVLSKIINFFKEKLIAKPNQIVNEIFVSPITGGVLSLDNIPDIIFSDRILGDGIAIMPIGNYLVAPCNGTIITIYDSLHAIVIESESGAEVFIHFGLNTIDLAGRHITSHVTSGQKVKQGQLLLEVELEEIYRKNIILATPIVISNFKGNKLVDIATEKTQLIAGVTPIFRIISSE